MDLGLLLATGIYTNQKGAGVILFWMCLPHLRPDVAIQTTVLTEKPDCAFDQFPMHHIQILLGGFTAEVGPEGIFNLAYQRTKMSGVWCHQITTFPNVPGILLMGRHNRTGQILRQGDILHSSITDSQFFGSSPRYRHRSGGCISYGTCH